MRPIRPMLQTFPAAIQNFPQSVRADPRLRLILSALGVVLGVGAIWYLLGDHSGSEAHRRPPPPVTIARARMENVIVAEHALGTVLANTTVNVTSRVDGQLASAAFKEGQIVHEGDILFRLDERPFVAALEQARAALSRDEAQYTAAQRSRDRYVTLAKENAISAEQRDQAVAQAGADAGTVKADRAAVALALLNLQFSVIHSPITGKTGPILIQPGNLVKANDSNAMVVVSQIQPVKVSFFLPQDDLPRIQDRQRQGKLTATAQAHGASQSDSPITAPVDFVSNAVDQKTGTIELRATYNNADLRLVPGQLVDVSVALQQLPHAIVVPREAVNTGPNGRYVYVVDKGKAEMRDVTVLYENGDEDAVSGDVHAGDRVVTEGQLGVLPGKPVAITRTGKAAR